MQTSTDSVRKKIKLCFNICADFSPNIKELFVSSTDIEKDRAQRQ